VEPLPEHREDFQGVDVVLEKPVRKLTPKDARQKYGRLVYAVAKRALSKHELKQWPIPLDWR
jgi:hypothetical protein